MQPRRKVLATIGTVAGVTLAGCSGDDSDGTGGTNGEEESEPDDDDDDGGNGEDDSIDQVFEDHRIDGTELIIELKEDSLNEVTEIRVETPNNEMSSDVSTTVESYEFDATEQRAGTWFIDAVDDDGDILETIEFETSFDISLEEIGTLAQLGITGESPIAEERDFQFTVANTGSIPFEILEFDMSFPGVDFELDTNMNWSTRGEIVDRNGSPIIPPNETNTYRYNSGNAATQPLVLRDSDAEQVAGETVPAELIVSYRIDRGENIIPIEVSFTEDRDVDAEVQLGSTMSVRDDS